MPCNPNRQLEGENSKFSTLLDYSYFRKLLEQYCFSYSSSDSDAMIFEIILFLFSKYFKISYLMSFDRLLTFHQK